MGHAHLLFPNDSEATQKNHHQSVSQQTCGHVTVGAAQVWIIKIESTCFSVGVLELHTLAHSHSHYLQSLFFFFISDTCALLIMTCQNVCGGKKNACRTHHSDCRHPHTQYIEQTIKNKIPFHRHYCFILFKGPRAAGDNPITGPKYRDRT